MYKTLIIIMELQLQKVKLKALIWSTLIQRYKSRYCKQSEYFAQSVNVNGEWMCFWSDGILAGSQKFSVLLFDAAVDGMVEAPVWCHEVSNDLSVVNPGQQVERHLYGQWGEELRKFYGRFNRNNNVTGPMQQSEWRDSGRKEDKED